MLRRPHLLLGFLFALALAALPSARGQDPAEHPLDQPIAWLNDARRAYASIHDYTCTLVTRETVRGMLQDENVIAFKARTQPFSVSMRWIAPAKLRNQEVCFVLGRNNNKMRVKSVGASKLVGFVSVDPKDHRVFEHSRHDIYEAGLGSLIEQTLVHWDTERKINKTRVSVAEYNYNNRACLRIETTRTERRPEFYCYRSVLYLDKESKLPLRTENYDWPRAGGPPDGDLIEMFSYVDLRFNVGLSDADFNK